MKIAVILVMAVNSSGYGYLIGVAIAILLFGYLIYSLVKPEKF